VSEYIVNAYCGSLSGTFAQFVYYGILKEEDAQCFRVNTSAEPGLFLLTSGAVILALINTFVLKAARQYDRDKSQCGRFNQHNDKVLSTDFDAVEADIAQTRNNIHPVPVLFTDTFRWLLQREDIILESHATEDFKSNDGNSCQNEDLEKIQEDPVDDDESDESSIW
jgi:hypothetical protein